MEKPQIWVFLEQRGGALSEVGLELLGQARELAEARDGTVAALLLGHQVAPLAGLLIAHGADLVLVADHPALEPYRLLPYTAVLARACRGHQPEVLLFGATAARLAARLDRAGWRRWVDRFQLSCCLAPSLRPTQEPHAPYFALRPATAHRGSTP